MSTETSSPSLPLEQQKQQPQQQQPQQQQPQHQQQQQQQPQYPVQIQAIPMQGQVQIGVPIDFNQLELQKKASSVHRIWCCNLVFSLVSLISGLILASQKCNNNNDGTDYNSYCDSTLWKVYSPAIAFGGFLAIMSVLSLRALNSSGCSHNIDVASYDLKTLKPILWIALLPSVGLLIWSAVYLIGFSYLSLVLFPYFIPCWAGCIVGLLGIIQISCCQRQMQTTMALLHIQGNAPPRVVLQQQFVQYPPQQFVQYAPQQQQQFVQYAPQQQQQYMQYAPQQVQQQPLYAQPVITASDYNN